MFLWESLKYYFKMLQNELYILHAYQELNDISIYRIR